MSDIQDLIHKTTMDCLERGKCEEQQRIIKLLEQTLGYGDEDWDADVMTCIALIKGEK